MPRDIPAALQTEFDARRNHIFHLLQFEFDTPTYYTDLPRSIVFGGNTYISAGDMIAVEDVTEELELKYDTLSVMLSGVSQANIAIALTAAYLDKKVKMHIGAVDTSGVVVVDPMEYYTGLVESFSIREDVKTGESIIVWVTGSHWSLFDKVSGRMTNDADQQYHFPGDKGLEFASEIVTEQVETWGRP